MRMCRVGGGTKCACAVREGERSAHGPCGVGGECACAVPEEERSAHALCWRGAECACAIWERRGVHMRRVGGGAQCACAVWEGSGVRMRQTEGRVVRVRCAGRSGSKLVRMRRVSGRGRRSREGRGGVSVALSTHAWNERRVGEAGCGHVTGSGGSGRSRERKRRGLRR